MELWRITENIADAVDNYADFPSSTKIDVLDYRSYFYLIIEGEKFIVSVEPEDKKNISQTSLILDGKEFVISVMEMEKKKGTSEFI